MEPHRQARPLTRDLASLDGRLPLRCCARRPLTALCLLLSLSVVACGLVRPNPPIVIDLRETAIPFCFDGLSVEPRCQLKIEQITAESIEKPRCPVINGMFTYENVQVPAVNPNLGPNELYVIRDYKTKEIICVGRKEL